MKVGTIEEIALQCGQSPHRLRRLVRSGKIPYCMVGNRYLLTVENVETFLRGSLPAEPIHKQGAIQRIAE